MSKQLMATVNRCGFACVYVFLVFVSPQIYSMYYDFVYMHVGTHIPLWFNVNMQQQAH